MGTSDADLPWDDDGWIEKSDTALQRRLRRHQTWWRESRAGLPAGPHRAGAPERLVGSTLPIGTPITVNLMTEEAVEAYDRAKAGLAGHAGLINADRLARSLLSSQPLAFNLFGHLASHADALLPWVTELDPDAAAVTDVRLEWAPKKPVAIGGSAFDAIVDYTTTFGERGFIGVEVKYHENLKASLTKPSARKWVENTTDGWKPGAADALDVTGLRQFWFNQILTNRTARSEDYDRGFGVVVACEDDDSAKQAAQAVSDQLESPAALRFSSIEHVVDTIDGHDEWKRRFTERYTDFALSSG